MGDHLEERLRDGLHAGSAPAAPTELRRYLERLGEASDAERPPRRSRLPILLAPAVVVALIAFVALVGGSTPSPSPSNALASATANPTATAIPPSPSATVTFPVSVDGLTVQNVSELLAARAAGRAVGGPYALRGYWSNNYLPMFCAYRPPGGVLLPECEDGTWGITERDEEIFHWDSSTEESTSAAGPHLTPYVEKASADRSRLFGHSQGANGQDWPPVPIVMVGHFDDPRAVECPPTMRPRCADRFVLDRIVMFDPESVPAPTPTPAPTPFPIADPPPALFTSKSCYPDKPKSFTGWATAAELHLESHLPSNGYGYAMVTRDVIPIQGWWDNPTYPGHLSRWWGHAVCFARAPYIPKFYMGTVDDGATFVEVDDGRRIPGHAPF
jgi:hypothetical protein